MTDTAIDVRKVTKLYGNTTALHELSLSILDNEFFTLLGPSGCGKTTLLRCIAGFEYTTSGDIALFGESLQGLSPNERPVNTVFQQYALFPHMSVLDNVMFGLRRLKKNEQESHSRAMHVLDLVQLDNLADRMPSQLSGGQQQRVALARALAPNPKVLLLDEPLSALDLKLRQEVRYELQQIQHETEITFVFVTHDQEEAITMSDRIAVMANGELQQVGTPQSIYESPENRFVADFIGDTNILEVMVRSISDGIAVCVLEGGTEVLCRAASSSQTGPGHVSIRPESICFSEPSEGQLTGVVERHTYLGTDLLIGVRTPQNVLITVRQQNTTENRTPSTGESVSVQINSEALRLLSD
ncbi:MAG: ABC transporter ATP-binding protein [Gammaproteobacteria bacterium]|nr:ABC transporter ATP-binding protein [Gammaproteobacteria bacterium]